MVQLIVVIVIIVVWFKTKAAIKRGWDKVRGSTTVELRVRPKTYRDYSPLVNLTEVVHYEVLVSLGLAKTIVENNYEDLETLIKGQHPNEVLTVGAFCTLAKKTMAAQNFEHAAVFTIFFDELDKAYQKKDKLKIADIMKAIEFAFKGE